MARRQTRTRERHFAEQVDALREEARAKVPEISQQFPMFTSHGLDHLDAVADAARKLSRVIDLTAEERFCLDAACYCHDLGMAHTEAQHSYALETRDGLRRWHAKLSAQYIHHSLPARCFAQESLRDAVSRIAEGHGRWDWHDSYFDDDNGIRIRLLTALLSLADALDLRSDRRVPSELRTASQLLEHGFLEEDARHLPAVSQHPELRHLSRVHWLRHYYSVQPGLTVDAVGRTASIRLKARIGLRESKPDRPVFDERESLIKELIQAELVELLEFPAFKDAIGGHLSVRLTPAPGIWPSFVESQPDPEKMVFPDALVETVFAARMVRPRSLPLDSSSYFKTRIEGFIGPADVQVSISWLPWFSRTDGSPSAETLRVADTSLRGLAERTWDFVLWPITPFLGLLYAEAVRGEIDDIQQRFNRMWSTTHAIKNGKYKKYYMALDQLLPPQPMTATSHVAKFGLYAGLPATGGDFLGGIVELSSPAQQSAFQTACEAAAKHLGIRGSREDLPRLLKEAANPEAAHAITVRSIQQIVTAFRRELQQVSVDAKLGTFLDGFEQTIHESGAAESRS